jgi:hypothetical protein
MHNTMQHCTTVVKSYHPISHDILKRPAPLGKRINLTGTIRGMALIVDLAQIFHR